MESNFLNQKCTVLINSCDRYAEAWKPFITLFDIHWKNCPFNVCIATESIDANFPNVTTIKTGTGSWSKRLNLALNAISTPYVIFMLEDFFLQGDVNEDELVKCVHYMENDPHIGAFYYCRTEGYDIPSNRYPGYFDMNKSNRIIYHLNCQAALWDRKTLVEATKNEISPWDFEMKGYSIVNDFVRQKDFYCSTRSFYDKVRKDDVFPYIVERSKGYGIFGSKWLWNNKKLFKKYSIDCPMNTLDHLSQSDYIVSQSKIAIARILGPIYTFLHPCYLKMFK